MAKYRKKPVVIEAVQWLPDKMLMKDVLDAFGGLSGMGSRGITRKKDKLIIKTLEGEMAANPGDWVIKGVKGELYPCKPDIFEQTYEAVNCKTCNDEGRVWDIIGEYYYDCPDCGV